MAKHVLCFFFLSFLSSNKGNTLFTEPREKEPQWHTEKKITGKGQAEKKYLYSILRLTFSDHLPSFFDVFPEV